MYSILSHILPSEKRLLTFLFMLQHADNVDALRRYRDQVGTSVNCIVTGNRDNKIKLFYPDPFVVYLMPEEQQTLFDLRKHHVVSVGSGPLHIAQSCKRDL